MPTISTLTIDVQTETNRLRRGLNVALGGLTALAAGAAFAFKQFEDAEKITKQTEAVLTSTGGAAHVTAKEVGDLATALMKKTAIDDETIRSGENLLLTFTKIRNEAGKGNDIFTQTTKIITDMSVALGQDMKSSAIQVGKALQDPILGLTALRRVGVNFNEQQSEMVKKMVESGHQLEAQKFILHELNTEFGGSAVAAKTASASMRVAFDELAETVGGLLAPVFQALLAGITAVVDFLKAHAGPALKAAQEWFAGVWESIGPLVTILGEQLWSAAQKIWHTFEENILPSLKKLWEAIKPLLPILGLLAAAILVIAAEVLPVLFKVMTAWIVVLADVVDFIRTKVIDPIIGFFQRLVDWFREHLGGIKDAFLGVWQAIAGAIGAIVARIVDTIRTIIDAVMDAIDWLKRLAGIGVPGPAAGTVGKGAPGAGQHAKGGIFTSPTLGIIGEAGPEAVIPLDKLGGFGTVINLTINGDVTGEEIVRKVRDGLLKLGARNGTTGL